MNKQKMIKELALIIAVVIFVVIVLLVKLQFAEENLSGFLYKRKSVFGYSRYSIRFSQNAGQDNQPVFCVKTGGNTDNQLKKLLGTDTKVNIKIPVSFRLDNPLSCNSYAELEKKN